MIFNPLFINESGTTQTLVSKPGKLSTNKYLFSDIVKVVMNPAQEQKKIVKNEIENISDDNTLLAMDGDKNPIKIKFKFLSDDDNEHAKLELADILPDEIAQLLVNNDAVPNDEKAISYISKEPLKGELQNFLNGLIGDQIIEQNINNESGLLLSMEDSKSAVNLELVKDSGSKTANDKIMVQTIVVPQKSKLLSLIGEGQSKETLFRFNNSSLNQSIENNINGMLTNSESDNFKPTLSVYSFKYGGDEFEPLTTNIKANSAHAQNIGFLNNNLNQFNIENQKVSLEKISFIPSELKNQNKDENKTILGLKRDFNNKIADLKLFTHNDEKLDKDYSVSKITIVKKNGEIPLLNDPNRNNKVDGKDIESALKRIDFDKKIEKQNLTLNQNNTKSELGSKENFNLISNIKSSNLNSDKMVNELFKNDKLSAKQESDDSSKLKIFKNLDQREDIAKTNENTLKSKEGLSEKVINEKIFSLKGDFKTVSLDDPFKTDNKLKQELDFAKNGNLEKPIIKMDEQHKNESSKSLQDKIIQPQIDSEKVVKETVHKSEEEKSSNKVDSKNFQNNSVENNHGSNEKNDPKVINATVVNIKEAETPQLKINKKVSIKVNGEVRTVSEKNEAGNGIVEENDSKGDTSPNKHQNDSDKSNSNPLKNSTFSENRTEFKSSLESAFHQVLNKEQVGTIGAVKEPFPDIDQKPSQRVIKSTEVIKEISKFISKQDKGSLSFDITPEHLGKMKISLETVDHVLKARIEVDNEQSKQLVEKNIDKLNQELVKNGVQLGSLNISLGYSKHHKDGKEIHNKNKKQYDPFGQVGEVEEEKEQKSLGYNTYEYIA